MTAIAIVIDVLEAKRTAENHYRSTNDQLVKNILKFCRENKTVQAVAIYTGICAEFDIDRQAPGLKGIPLLKETETWGTAQDLFAQATDPVVSSEWAVLNSIEKYQATMAQDEYTDSARTLARTTPFVQPNAIGQPGTDYNLLTGALRPDQLRVGCWTMNQLIYLTDHCFESPVTDIYFFGGSFDHCLKTRDIGYEKVSVAVQNKLFATDKRILTKKDCVYADAGPVVVDKEIQQNWKKTNNLKYHDVYQLKPTGTY